MNKKNGGKLIKCYMWKEKYNLKNITEYMEKFYGDDQNWKNKLYKYKNIFPIKYTGYKIYFEFLKKDGSTYWFYSKIGNPNQYFHPITKFN